MWCYFFFFSQGWNLLRASGRFIAQGTKADELIQKFLAGESNLLRKFLFSYSQ